MNPETKALIETYLFAAGEWVSTEDICQAFHVTERQFRQINDAPGLLTEFAISRTSKGGGFKHIKHATTKEWLEFKHKKKKHGISELIGVRILEKKRHDSTRTVHNVQFEKDTGQGLLLPVEGVA